MAAVDIVNVGLQLYRTRAASPYVPLTAPLTG
jgi:hypothetical protein